MTKSNTCIPPSDAVLKLTTNNTTRRILVSDICPKTSEGCYNRLLQVAIQDSSVLGDTVIRMTYIDEDGDNITISSDRELLQAIDHSYFCEAQRKLIVKAEVLVADKNDDATVQEQTHLLNQIVDKNNELIDMGLKLKAEIDKINSKEGSKLSSKNAQLYPLVYIINQETGKALHVKHGGKTNGTNVCLWELNYTGAQKWTLKNDDTICNPQSGLCLTVYCNDTVNRNVHIWEKNGTNEQEWKFCSDGTIMSSKSGKRLDIYDGRNENGTHIIIYGYHSGKNQQWRIVPTCISHLCGKAVNIVQPESGNAINIAWGGTDNGTKIHMHEHKPISGSQQWILTSDNTIYNPHSGKCLDVSQASDDNGAMVHLWEKTGEDSQIWKLQKDGTIRNKSSGKCLSIRHNNYNIHIWEHKGNSLRQQWRIVSV